MFDSKYEYFEHELPRIGRKLFYVDFLFFFEHGLSGLERIKGFERIKRFERFKRV